MRNIFLFFSYFFLNFDENLPTLLTFLFWLCDGHWYTRPEGLKKRLIRRRRRIGTMWRWIGSWWVELPISSTSIDVDHTKETNPRNVHSEHGPQFQFQSKESGYTCTKLSSILVILLPSQILEFQFLNQHNKSVNNIIFLNKIGFYLAPQGPPTI